MVLSWPAGNSYIWLFSFENLFCLQIKELCKLICLLFLLVSRLVTISEPTYFFLVISVENQAFNLLHRLLCFFKDGLLLSSIHILGQIFLYFIFIVEGFLMFVMTSFDLFFSNFLYLNLLDFRKQLF
jgi:hypothetical protein